MGSSSQKTPVTGSSAHETPEASGSEDGSEDTFSNDSLPNTQLSLTGLVMVEEGFEWKATWGRLEIKFLWLDWNVLV